MSKFEESELYPEPGDAPAERAALLELAARLEAERPVPAAGFRGELRRRLLGRLGDRPERPQFLTRLVALYAGSGFALLAIATLGVGGVGPLSTG